ncbi:MAG: IS3 family transposase [Syntrophales bacterium]
MTGGWVPHDIRDAVIDFTRSWSNKTDIPLNRFIGWLAIGKSKFYAWVERYGKVNEHNASIPRDFWLEEWEREAIIRFCIDNPTEGYRRLAFMMLDRDIVAVSPTSTWRVLSMAGLLDRWNRKPSKMGTGFVQPLLPHEHWHADISYINICCTFYYLCSLLDGCSRFIVHWEIREHMTEADVEIIIQRAKEKFPDARPRIISDNGPQFIARDFKEFIRLSGMTHVKTSPFYPQSNGKLERFHKTLKGECIRPKTPLSLDDARRIVAEYIEYYNTGRLHSAIGYIAPADKLNGRDKDIFKERAQKLEAAREQRRIKRQQIYLKTESPGETYIPLSQTA